MDKFGLIGRTLKHSYSKTIHNLLGEYEYELYELEPEKVGDFVRNSGLKGFNVTIPYKKDVMQYLDKIDKSALLIGAVNTVVERKGKLIGYNTDFKGMTYMLKRTNVKIKKKKVMILGSGGTSNTAQAVVKYLKAREVVVVSRTGKVNYDNYLEHSQAEVIINTTPVGMYPDNYSCPIDLGKFTNLESVVDVIYNPNMTMLMYKAMERGVKHTNGLPMLVAQAKYANEYFFCKKKSNKLIEKVISNVVGDKTNLVLIGMPGCGKTTLGKKIAKDIGREFIDTDDLIVEKLGMDIPTIFEKHGEEYFRKIESEVVKEVGKLTGKVIATGGGVVKNIENYFPLKSNGVIIWLNRDIEKLATTGRPLSKDLNAVKKLYLERKGLYEYFADHTIVNDIKEEEITNE